MQQCDKDDVLIVVILLTLLCDGADGTIHRYQGIGLKGPVGAWAKSTYIGNPHIHPIRYHNTG